MSPSMTLAQRIASEADGWYWEPPDSIEWSTPYFTVVSSSLEWYGTVVTRTRCRSDRIDAVIAEAIEWARSQKAVQLRWRVSPASEPPNLATRLGGTGFDLLETVDIVSLGLESRTIADLRGRCVFPNVSTRAVDDEQAFGAFAQVSAKAWGGPAPTEEELHRRFAAFDAERSGTRVPTSFLSEVDGSPAAVADLTLREATARLWGAATLPKFRHRGAYRALVAERCSRAFEVGANLALAKALTNTSAPILTGLGFKLHNHEDTYIIELAPRT